MASWSNESKICDVRVFEYFICHLKVLQLLLDKCLSVTSLPTIKTVICYKDNLNKNHLLYKILGYKEFHLCPFINSRLSFYSANDLHSIFKGDVQKSILLSYNNISPTCIHIFFKWFFHYEFLSFTFIYCKL